MNKSEMIARLRVTTDERIWWQHQAESADMTLSEWIRKRCNGGGRLANATSRAQAQKEKQ